MYLQKNASDPDYILSKISGILFRLPTAFWPRKF